MVEFFKISWSIKDEGGNFKLRRYLILKDKLTTYVCIIWPFSMGLARAVMIKKSV